MVGAQDAELGEGVGVVGQPGAAGLFEPRVQDVLMAGLDEAAADGQIAGEGPGVVQAFEAVAQVAQRAAHRGFGIVHCRRFAEGLQRFEDQRGGSALEPLLLSCGASSAARVAGRWGRRRLGIR